MANEFDQMIHHTASGVRCPHGHEAPTQCMSCALGASAIIAVRRLLSSMFSEMGRRR